MHPAEHEIYDSIGEDLLKKCERIATGFRYQFESEEGATDNRDKLLEIGRYVCAGSYLGWEKGLYGERHKITDYIVKQKAKEFQDDKLNTILKKPNVEFYISSCKVAGNMEARGEDGLSINDSIFKLEKKSSS
jgi:hypothetical protein